MEIDPALLAVVGALSTVAGLLYRSLLYRATAAEEDARFWRDRALTAQGMTSIAIDEAERRQTA